MHETFLAKGRGWQPARAAGKAVSHPCGVKTIHEKDAPFQRGKQNGGYPRRLNATAENYGPPAARDGIGWRKTTIRTPKSGLRAGAGCRTAWSYGTFGSGKDHLSYPYKSAFCRPRAAQRMQTTDFQTFGKPRHFSRFPKAEAPDVETTQVLKYRL